MSSKTTPKKCIIQKLDFENCIVTNLTTTTSGRKRLRARITREIEKDPPIREEEEEEEEEEEPLNCSSEVPEPTSPVLIKKQRNRESPVFFKRKKHPPEKPDETELSSPGSPVFKSFKKQKRDTSSKKELDHVLGKTTSSDMFNSQGSSSLQSSYQIEEFSQESEPSIKISSVESADVKNDNRCSISIESSSVVSFPSPVQISERFNLRGKFESPKSFKRNYKKNSLLGRLHKLQKKQASEKLLWQHQNRRKSSASFEVSVESFWKEEFNYFLKCQSDSESSLLIVDSRWVPNIKNVKPGSVLLIHPFWQKLTIEGSAMTVLLNLICLDVLDETKEPSVREKTTQSVPPEVFEADPKLFVDSLFSSCSAGFYLPS